MNHGKIASTRRSYEDENGNLHYADYRKNKEYIIPKEKQGVFRVLKERYFAAFVISLVLTRFKVPIYLCIAAGVLIAILLRLFYIQKILPQMQSKKLDVSKFEHTANKEKSIGIILISFIIICFAIMNNYFQNYQDTNIQAFILSWALVALSFLTILKQVYTLKKGGK